MTKRIYNQFVLSLLALCGYSFFAQAAIRFVRDSHLSTTTLLATIFCIIVLPLAFLFVEDLFDMFV